MNQAEDNLIWIDLEMTGLDPETDRIIEIATLVTDKDLHRTFGSVPEVRVPQQEALASLRNVLTACAPRASSEPRQNGPVTHAPTVTHPPSGATRKYRWATGSVCGLQGPGPVIVETGRAGTLVSRA